MSINNPNTNPSTNNSTAMTGNVNADSAARLVLGWTLMIVLLAAITRTRVGYVVMYYALSLAILLLVLGAYPRVVDLLSVVRAPNGPAGG